MIFSNREEAGARLAAALRAQGVERPLVLGIPRGGVAVAASIARALGGELGVIVARKLGAPGHEELAVGAVTSDGARFVNEALAAEVGADEDYLAREIERQLAEARRREEIFDHRLRPKLSGRTVVLTDDGIATGATAIAALRSIRRAGAKEVILAVPVAPPETLRALAPEADRIVCLIADPYFVAVGEYYRDFRQVEDEEVKALLDSFVRSGAEEKNGGF